MSIKAIFLDRDGTLVKDYEDDQWHHVKKLELFPDTIPALQRIPDEFKLFIVTNQYLIQENFITFEQFRRTNREFLLDLILSAIPKTISALVMTSGAPPSP